MNMKKVSSVLISMGLVLSFSTSVFAEQGDPSNYGLKEAIVIYDQDTIKASFEELDIDVQTQERLLVKLESGQLIDSLNPEKINEGVSTKFTNQQSSNTIRIDAINAYTIRTVFPDGSVSVRGIEPGPGTVCGTGYCNYNNTKISYNTGVINSSFLANYSIVNGGYSSISRVWNADVYVLGGTVSDLELKITRPTETYSYSANATMTWAYNTVFGSTFQHLDLDIKNGNASYSNN